MNVIVRRQGTESAHKQKEAAAQTLRHYYGREIRDGSRFRTKGNFSKEQIKRIYASS